MITRHHLRALRADILAPVVAAFAAYVIAFNARGVLSALRDFAWWLQ